jgi:hypothetical protein
VKSKRRREPMFPYMTSPTWTKRIGTSEGEGIGAGLIVAAAPVYAFIETAKLNQVDPRDRLTDVLGDIAAHKIIRIDELRPWHDNQ